MECKVCGVDEEEGLSMEMEEKRRRASRRSVQREKVKKKTREI